MTPDNSLGITGSTIFQGMAGGAVGVGIMILFLAKWGSKLFGAKGVTDTQACPYAGDHPKMIQFMGESLRDRADMRKFLEDINKKVDSVSIQQATVVGKLDMVLRSVRVRWNEEENKK